LAFGAWIGVLMIVIASVRKTSSNAEVNFASRSRISAVAATGRSRSDHAN